MYTALVAPSLKFKIFGGGGDPLLKVTIVVLKLLSFSLKKGWTV
jgi:hypothetical protein